MTAIISNSDWLTALDGYHVVRELGRGGMGAVYEVIETELSRRVALKVLPRAAALDARQLVRFQNEAQAAARLDHAHIVPVYTVGCKDGMHFYAMKYIDGRSLAEVIDAMQNGATADENIDAPGRHGLFVRWPSKAVANTANRPRTALEGHPTHTISGTDSSSTIGGAPRHMPSSLDFFHAAAGLGIQAAEALHHAHSSGITHGDVKPANLLVDVHGQLWLTDFGLARSTSELQNSTAATTPGTLRYLSPEQARAEHAVIDHRTDIYSLGATLFELVTLTPAVCGENPSEILNQIAFGKAPLASDYNPAIPTELQAILCQAMAADPKDRYATARELAEDLQRFLAGQPVHAKSAAELDHPRNRSRRRPALLAAAVLVTILVLVPLVALVPPMPKRAAASRLTPEEEALRSLRALNETYLIQLDGMLARGGEPTDQDRRLLKDGPGIFNPYPLMASNSEKQIASASFELAKEQYQFELAKAYYQLGEIHGRLNDHELQGQMLRRSTELFEQLVGRSLVECHIPAALATIAEGEVHAAAGRNEEANKLGARAIASLQAIRKADLENPDYKIALAFVETRFGRMLGNVLPAKEVEQHHRTAVALLEPLVQNPPPWHPNLFFPYQNLDDALAECRVNLASSLEPSDETKKILEVALEYLTGQTEPEAEWRTSLLAQAERNLGIQLKELDQPADAERHLRRSIDLFDGLLSEFPAVVKYQYGLATAVSALGLAFSSDGKQSEAVTQFQQAIDQLQDLVNSYPAVADYRHLLAGNINNIVHAKSDGDAVAGYEQALQHQLAAIGINPEHRQYRLFASIQSSNLAKKLAELKDNGKAAVQMSNAIEHRTFVIEHGSLRYQDKHSLGRYWSQLGIFLSEDGRNDEAEKANREGIELFRKLVDQFGRRTDDLSMLGSTLNKLALQLESRGEIDSARQHLQEAVTVQQEALRSEPDNTQYREFLKNHETGLERLSAANEAP